MADISSFLNQIKQINWLEKCGVPNENYHVVYSIFEAYDDWNQAAFDTWEPHICKLEKKAQEIMGDEWIDEVFEAVSNAIGDILWEKWGTFIERCNLREECGLDNEIMDFMIRDIAWACIEDRLEEKGFFTEMLDIYKKGYFPCSWSGGYPDGKPVVL